MKIKITFADIFDNLESEEQAYDVLLEYLRDCVKHEDVSAFEFEEVLDEEVERLNNCDLIKE